MEEDAEIQRTILKQQAEMHKLGLQHLHEGRQTQTQQAMDLGSQQMQHQHGGSLHATSEHRAVGPSTLPWSWLWRRPSRAASYA